MLPKLLRNARLPDLMVQKRQCSLLCAALCVAHSSMTQHRAGCTLCLSESQPDLQLATTVFETGHPSMG